MNAETDRSILSDVEPEAEPENVDYGAEKEDVEVKTERLTGRKRQISATIHIPCSLEQIWQILTDYEHLADFIPNLAHSRRIGHPQGGIRLEQIGTESFLKLKFCARVVLDMMEQPPNQISFCMVEGDFKEFSGSWQLQPQPVNGQPGTILCYSVQVLPPITMPIGLIEGRLQRNLVRNLMAIRAQATQSQNAIK